MENPPAKPSLIRSTRMTRVNGLQRTLAWFSRCPLPKRRFRRFPASPDVGQDSRPSNPGQGSSSTPVIVFPGHLFPMSIPLPTSVAVSSTARYGSCSGWHRASASRQTGSRLPCGIPANEGACESATSTSSLAGRAPATIAFAYSGSSALAVRVRIPFFDATSRTVPVELSSTWIRSKTSHIASRLSNAAVQRRTISLSGTWWPPSSTRRRTRAMLRATCAAFVARGYSRMHCGRG